MNRRIFLLAFCIFLGPFCGNTVLSMLHRLTLQFETDMVMISLAITVFMLPFALLQLVSGTLSDLWDRRRVLMLGLGAFIAGVLLCALASSLRAFLAGRVLQGLGFAFVYPVALAIIGDIVPASRRGNVMGWMGSMTTFGIATGPLVGGLLAGINWRLAFFLISALALAALLLLSGSKVGSFAGKKEHVPLKELVRGALRHRGVRIVSLSGFLANWAFVTVLSSLSPYLSAAPFGLSDAQVGTVISAAGLAGILISPLAGRTVDHIGRSITSILGLVSSGVVFAALIFAGTWGAMAGSFFLLGAVMAFSWAGLVTLSVEILPGARGTSSSFFHSARFLGYALAPQVSSVLFLRSGIRPVFLSAAAASFAAAFLAASLKRGEEPLPADGLPGAPDRS